ncbi:MAG: DUF222 domain-containing protein [Actinobacteria bacterium]|uniref:Unannotated protein n=1 Tax=freshwater metagenome TaxID=449393 RepID=A0A6J6PWV1_9ZZZZ|nr:DUF222 domain-containing protein [Actinomycetota bacterium]
MSVHALPTPTLSPAVVQARACLDEARAVEVAGVDEGELPFAIGELAALESQAAALRLTLSAEAERRRLAVRSGATGTDAWAAALTGDTREVWAGGLRIARLLRDKYAATRAAYAEGRLRSDQVRVIVNAAEQAPPEATHEQIATAETILVDKATGVGTRSGRPMNARRLRQVARRMFDPVDRDLADRHEAIMLGRESAHARRETYLSLHDNGDGTWSGRFVVPELHGSLLRQALDRLRAPRRLTRDRDGRTLVDPSAPAGLGGYELDGAALCELVEHLPTVGHAANGVTSLVTIGLEALRGEPGAGRLDTGTRITASEARRLACEAGLVPVVLGGESVPLDLGRERRLHSSHQRRALAVVHDTCAVDGCERPFAWCEIHHPLPWSQGGRTDLSNAVPLCGWHHQRAHDDHFELRRASGIGWRLHPRR